jgi:hypothetical protein
MLAVELDYLVGVIRGGDIVKYVAVVSKSFVDKMPHFQIPSLDSPLCSRFSAQFPSLLTKDRA